MNPNSKVSAHAVFAVNGKRAKVVSDNNIAWHAGINNAEYLGCELEQGKSSDTFSEMQYVCLANWIKEMAKKYNFAPIRDNLLGHDETLQGISQGKTDPGMVFNWDKLINML